MVFKKCFVYKIHCSYITPPHNKFSICVCPSKAQFLWINTDPRKTRQQSQVLINREDLSFLRHDSYVDAGQLFTFPPSDLNTAKEIVMLLPNIANKIKAAIKNSPYLTDGQQKLVINCFESTFQTDPLPKV